MRDRSCPQNNTVSTHVRRKTRTPSFSSSLLDSICRSIDNPSPDRKPDSDFGFYGELGPAGKKQSSGDRNPPPVFSNSGSSSSGDSTLFSSSETESNFRNPQTKPNQDRDGFAKTKQRALKLYGELKKMKQPISPGGRISTFLSSVFNSGGRKAKTCSAGAVDDVNFECKSTRSCMNKTGQNPKLAGAKRSVRFSPAGGNPSLTTTVIKKQSINGGIEAAAREFLRRSYEKKKGMIEFDDDDDDDGESCASSDLFELDHLMEKAWRYREELPVYETTSLRTNKAIAGGFIF